MFFPVEDVSEIGSKFSKNDFKLTQMQGNKLLFLLLFSKILPKATNMSLF